MIRSNPFIIKALYRSLPKSHVPTIWAILDEGTLSQLSYQTFSELREEFLDNDKKTQSSLDAQKITVYTQFITR